MKLMQGIYPRGKGYQVKLKLPGHDKRLTGTFSDPQSAEAFILQAKAAALTGKALPDIEEATSDGSGGLTIQALFEKVDGKRWRGNPKAKSGELGSCANAERFIRWCGPKMQASEALSEESIASFVEYREDEFLNSGSTINRYLAAISALCKEAVKLKIIPCKPDMPQRSEGNCRIRVYTVEEERAILATTRQWGYDDLADWLEVLCDTGARPKELHLLEWQDIFSGNGVTRLHFDKGITKNSTARTLKATPRVVEALGRMKVKYGHLKGPFAWVSSRDRAPRTLWNRLRGHLNWMDETTVIYTYRHTCAGPFKESSP